MASHPSSILGTARGSQHVPPVLEVEALSSAGRAGAKWLSQVAARLAGWGDVCEDQDAPPTALAPDPFRKQRASRNAPRPLHSSLSSPT